jgi:hypothetical protein
MNKFKWFFMSRYKKLLYAILCAKANEQRLYLENGVTLDFTVPYGTVKVYKVTLKNPTDDDPFYMVDAPNEYIAKWCGANLYNNEFIAFKSAKDMNVEEFKLEEEQ